MSRISLRIDRMLALAVAGPLLAASGASAQEASPPATVEDSQLKALEDAVRTLTEENSRLRQAAEAPTAAPSAAPSAELQPLRDELAAANARVAKLEDELAAAHARNEQARVAAAETATLRENLTAAERSVQELERDLFARDEQITRLRADLLAARNDLSAVEGQLQAKTKEALALAEAGRGLVAAREAAEAELVRLEAAEVSPAIEPAAGPPARDDLFAAVERALGPQAEIVVEGNRLILPVDLAFESASAVLQPVARARVVDIGRSLSTAGRNLPSDDDWLVQVEGHSDRRPVGGRVFASNRELSAKRAVSVVDALAEGGVPPERLVAAGLGDTHPLDPADTPEAYRRNRRVELRVRER
jgi:chemotaxis protein MotB